MSECRAASPHLQFVKSIKMTLVDKLGEMECVTFSQLLDNLVCTAVHQLPHVEKL